MSVPASSAHPTDCISKWHVCGLNLLEKRVPIVGLEIFRLPSNLKDAIKVTDELESFIEFGAKYSYFYLERFVKSFVSRCIYNRLNLFATISFNLPGCPGFDRLSIVTASITLPTLCSTMYNMVTKIYANNVLNSFETNLPRGILIKRLSDKSSSLTIV